VYFQNLQEAYLKRNQERGLSMIFAALHSSDCKEIIADILCFNQNTINFVRGRIHCSINYTQMSQYK
jgi:hypothetical protein